MKRLNVQKLFWFISFLFILSCCLFYGIRFLKLYLDNKKVIDNEINSLVRVVRENSADSEYFKLINGKNYFTDKADNNYLEYSNIMFRIININSDNSITLISDYSLTTLANGVNKSYLDSHIYKWLNVTDEEYSGILERSLNNIESYLQKSDTCTDLYNELSNDPCVNVFSDSYIGLLSVVDYLNVGSGDSYLNNGEYFYLGSNNDEGESWYVSSEGLANLNNGSDIIGIRPVITLKANIDYVSGDGSKDNPYRIEKENGLFGSYVKLDDDIWRIYEVNDTEVRLMLNDYLRVDGSKLTYQYSLTSSYYDDYSRNSIAYYLNHTFLDSLSYKDKIKEVYFANGTYNSSNDYDYVYSLNEEINTRVALMSIGNIYLNHELSNYYTMTGTSNKGASVYTIQENKNIYTKNISQKIRVVPVISIEKNLLTKGNGTVDSPFEME